MFKINLKPTHLHIFIPKLRNNSNADILDDSTKTGWRHFCLEPVLLQVLTCYKESQSSQESLIGGDRLLKVCVLLLDVRSQTPKNGFIHTLLHSQIPIKVPPILLKDIDERFLSHGTVSQGVHRAGWTPGASVRPQVREIVSFTSLGHRSLESFWNSANTVSQRSYYLYWIINSPRKTKFWAIVVVMMGNLFLRPQFSPELG